MTNMLKITKVTAVPIELVGTPSPAVVSEDSGSVWLAYHTHEPPEATAVLNFGGVFELRKGYPNDEGFHPYSGRGLGCYGLFVVEDSPRIEQIVQEQLVDSRRREGWAKNYRYWIYRFKETTIEVIGLSLHVAHIDRISECPLEAILSRINSSRKGL